MVKGVCVSEEMTTAAAAGGTHPTGMHSCFFFGNFVKIVCWCYLGGSAPPTLGNPGCDPWLAVISKSLV